MTVSETPRLLLRHINLNDAPFILTLLNDPSFLIKIGDKGVRNLEDACKYILDGPVKSYKTNGYGPNLVELKETGCPIGICGIYKREILPHPDIGFAFLPAYWAQGYAYESADAVLNNAKTLHKLDRILGIASPSNSKSIRLLEKLGLVLEGTVRLTPESSECKLFARGL